MPNHLPWTLLLTALGLGWIEACVGIPQALAQIRPDGTLGTERSLLRPNASSDHGSFDRIRGGALRGNSLFHSFSEFNVLRGQRVYFANPAEVNQIITRITGANRSTINGTLGVEGTADLFLINPNGIVLGPSSQFDIRGSFVASTIDELPLGEGYQFSASDPDAVPLLTVTAPIAGLVRWLPSSGTIESAGNLSVGEDLTLVAHDIDVMGSLQAGNELTLIAERLTLSDRPSLPLEISAGDRLELQGNQTLNITALEHPDSRLRSGAEMVLRSQNPVGADAALIAGGDLRIETLERHPGQLESQGDPVFETAGNFRSDTYRGASLQILAGGSVAIDRIRITGTGDAFNDGNITLSDGTELAIQGTQTPTVDIRAGTTRFFGDPEPGNPRRADITINHIRNPGGLVFLSNQFRPNSALVGDITVGEIVTADGSGGGDVVIDSRGAIAFDVLDVSGLPLNDPTFTNPFLSGDAGDITLLADGEILISAELGNNCAFSFASTLCSFGLTGGDISIQSDTAIRQENSSFGTDPFELSSIQSFTVSGNGGDINLEAPVISLGGNIESLVFAGEGGDLTIAADTFSVNQGTIATETVGSGQAGRVRIRADVIDLDYVLLGSFDVNLIGVIPTGNTGEVTVRTLTLTGIRGAQITSFVTGEGDAGDVTVRAAEAIDLSGFQPPDLAEGFAPSGIISSSQSGARGDSGTVTVRTGTLRLSEGAVVSSSAFGVRGNAGRVDVEAVESVTVDGAVLVEITSNSNLTDTHPSAIGSEVRTNVNGRGGDVQIVTPVLEVTHGGLISTATDGTRSAGDLEITATESALFDGQVLFGLEGIRDRISGISVETLENAGGDGGTLTLTTPNLTIAQGARLEATTRGTQAAGNLVFNIEDTLTIEGTGSGIFANTVDNSSGDGGNIIISNPNQITLRSGGEISVDSQGTGTGGNIDINAGVLVQESQSRISAETASNTGGDITLQLSDLLTLRQTSRISTTAGTTGSGGDGGNIRIEAPFVVAVPEENNDITANAFRGQGGRVDITTEGIFGLTPRSREELEALLGTQNPQELDPANLTSSDITAISQVNPQLNGVVIIRTPDVDPNRGAVTLPDEVIDASRLIAQGCSAEGGAIATSFGSLIVTGRGGLPQSPTQFLSSDTILVGWDSFNAESTQEELSGANRPEIPPASPLIEVQALVERPDGQVVLVSESPLIHPQVNWNPPVLCSPMRSDE